jgi:UDP-glucuronate decarboxylase
MDDKYFLPSDIKEIVARISDLNGKFSGKSILMSGGNGFLGRYVRAIFQYMNQHVLDKKCKLVLLDNFTTSQQSAFCCDDDAIECVPQDVIKPFSYDKPVDYVVHAAGIASPFYYRAKPLQTLDVAVQGSKHMLEIAKQHHARFVFFSSSEIYGDPDPKHVPMQESYRGNVSVAGPRACYDESKRLGETLCYIYHNEFGVHTNMIRPFNVYGPGMQEKDYRVMPNFASKILRKEPLQIYGKGSQTRTFCYIADAMVGFLRVIASGVAGEPYNIGTEKPELSMLSLVQAMSTVMGRSLPYDIIDYPDSYPADEPMRRCPDLRKANFQLDYTPEVPFLEGLKRYMAWASKHYTYEKEAASCQVEHA